ncbi:MAG: hypothetical protein JWL81_797, partial [Verrucomicrobiales bacterium]|nr:hypothetical protein [Verrucomicrobiales bacterium]
EHKTKDGMALFSVAALKADSKRLTLVFDSSEPVSANLIKALQKTLDCGFEIYLASSSFRFGVFVRTSEILVWEAE